MRSVLVLLAAALCLLSLASAQTRVVPAGTVTTLTTTNFPLAGDSLSCLTANATQGNGVATSHGGAIYTFGSSLPNNLSYTYVAGNTATQTGSYFVDCVSNPSGSLVYLLDTQQANLYSYAPATPTVAPVLVASFIEEHASALTSLAIDFVSGTAYVGTTASAQIYFLPLTPNGQTITIENNGAQANGNVYSLVLSADAATIYYGLPSSGGVNPGYVYAVPVSDVVNNYDAQTTAYVVGRDPRIVAPDTLVIVGNTMYIKDGGAYDGVGNGGNVGAGVQQSIYNLSLAGVTTSAYNNISALLYSTTALNLPKGLLASTQNLYFTTTNTIDSISLLPQTVAVAAVSSTAAPVSSSAAVPAVSSSAAVPAVSSSAAVRAASSSAAASSTGAVRSSSAAVASSSAAVPAVSSSAAVPVVSSSAAVPAASSSAAVRASSTAAVAPVSSSAAVPAASSSAAAATSAPVAASSSAAPVAASSSVRAAVSSSAAVPAVSSSAAVPVVSSSAAAPVASSSAAVPVVSSSAAVPVASSSAAVRASSTAAAASSSAAVPAVSSSAAVPVVSSSAAVRAVSSSAAAVSSSAAVPVVSSSAAVPVASSSAAVRSSSAAAAVVSSSAAVVPSTAAPAPSSSGRTAVSITSSSSSATTAYPAGSEQLGFRLTEPSSVNVSSPAFIANLTQDLAANLAAQYGLTVAQILPYLTITSVQVVGAAGQRRLLQATQTVNITFVISGNINQLLASLSALQAATTLAGLIQNGTLSTPTTGATVPAQQVTIVNPNAPAAVSSSSSSGASRVSAVGDPLFAGFQGQRYQVHGIDGAVYALLSQRSLHINALFVFLDSGKCPVVGGVQQQANCWSHPGSYFGQLAFQTNQGVQLEIVAGAANKGIERLQLNGQDVLIAAGEQVVAGSGDSQLVVKVLSSHALSIETGNYQMQIDNSDMFLNLAALRVMDWGRLIRTDQPHGLLGQSWTRRSRAGKLSKDGLVNVKDVVEGDVDDYVVAEDSMLGTDFAYSKFDAKQ